MANVEYRGTHAQRITLDREEAARMTEQAARLDPAEMYLTPPTVLFFTGTREGCAPEQLERLREFIYAHDLIAAHDGLCVGADAQFHEIVWNLKGDDPLKPVVVGWPAEVIPELTVADRVKCDNVKVKLRPLHRNKEMAAHAASIEDRGKYWVELVACPATEEPLADGRGGTWHCVRQFVNVGIPVTIITPTGRIRHESAT